MKHKCYSDPPCDKLIRTMSQEKVGWSTPRIHRELQMIPDKVFDSHNIQRGKTDNLPFFMIMASISGDS